MLMPDQGDEADNPCRTAWCRARRRSTNLCAPTSTVSACIHERQFCAEVSEFISLALVRKREAKSS